MNQINNIQIKINNIQYLCQKPLTLFQACLEKKIYIPRFCYHSSLKIAGNCRMCLIEEKSSIKPLASCAVTITPGLHVFTNTEIVKKAREGVLEYLLINHPLDCPICDQGGECDLQDQTMVFGADRGRFYDLKRSTPNKNLGFLVKTYLNRCIHCARCTRFLQDLNNNYDLSLLGRGYKTEISNYTKNFLNGELVGNIIDLCPVGALTSKPYAFKARVWELTSVYTFDILDGFGSQIQLDFRGVELLRILPKINKNLNEEWISDNTRFYLDSIYLQRLTIPYYKLNSYYTKVNWNHALNIIKNFFYYYQIVYKKNKSYLSASNLHFGDFTDIDSAISVKNFYKTLGYKLRGNLVSQDFRKNYFLNLNIFNEDNKKNYLIIDINLRFVSPILNLKILRSVIENNSQTFILGSLHNINYNYKHTNIFFDKYIYKFINNLNSLYVFSPNKYTNKIFKNCSYVASSITFLTLSELGLCNLENTTFTPIQFYLGQLEHTKKNLISFFNVHMLHHIEDDYIISFRNSHNILLPTKYYYEKLATYVNNNFYFFKTVHHYTFNLQNTKEEWNIINAISIKLALSQDRLNIIKTDFKCLLKKYLPNLPINYKLGQFFITSCINNTIYIKKHNIKKSVFTDFFSKNVLTRLSPTLNLCSKKLAIQNDYVFTTIIENI